MDADLCQGTFLFPISYTLNAFFQFYNKNQQNDVTRCHVKRRDLLGVSDPELIHDDENGNHLVLNSKSIAGGISPLTRVSENDFLTTTEPMISWPTSGLNVKSCNTTSLAVNPMN